MDIAMPQLSGIELCMKMNQLYPDCQIAYHTNYLEYATEVYETNHCYYILKDQLGYRLPKLMAKITQKKESNQKKIVLKRQEGIIVVAENQIIYIERMGKNSHIHMEDGSIIKTGQKLQELLELMESGGFIRCHNSYVVSFARIKKYTRQIFVMENGFEIPISRGYARSVKEAFARWSGSLM